MNSSSSGDLYVPANGYYAIIDTLLAVDGSNDNYFQSSFSNAFDKLCGANEDVPAGCAVLAVEFYGGDDKVISKYNFQVFILYNK